MQLSNFFFEVTILALFYFDDINTLHKVVAKKKCKTNVRQYSLVTLSNTWQFAVPLAAFNYLLSTTLFYVPEPNENRNSPRQYLLHSIKLLVMNTLWYLKSHTCTNEVSITYLKRLESMFLSGKYARWLSTKGTNQFAGYMKN